MNSLKNKRTLLFLACTPFVLFLIGYVCLGFFSRPMADDLIFLNGYGFSDFVANFNHLYTVNGRLTTLTIYLLGFTIPIISQLTPLLTALILGVGFYLLGLHFLRDKTPTKMLHPLTLLSTLVLLSTAFILIPSAPSSIFWFSAAVVHIWSYGFILMLVAFMLHLRQRHRDGLLKKRSILAYVIFTILIALCGEMPALTVIAVHIFILINDYARKNKGFFVLTTSGLVSGLTAFSWLYFAPASIARRSIIEASGGLTATDFIKTLPQELLENITIELPYLLQNENILIMLFFFALLVGVYFTKNNSLSKPNIIIYIVIALLLSLFHIINYSLTYVAGGSVPLRIYPSSILGVSTATFIFGYLAGYFLKKRPIFWRGAIIGALSTLFFIGIIHSSAYIPWAFSLGKELKSHATAWDARDAYIKNQIEKNNCQVRTVSLPIGDIGDIDQDPSHWINRQGFKEYYQPPSNPNYWQSCSITGTGKFGL